MRRGRKPSADSRRALLQLRLTEGEFESIKETAAHYDWSVSKLVRVALGLESP